MESLHISKESMAPAIVGPFIPVTPRDSSTSMARPSHSLHRKYVPTKTMVQQAFKSLTTEDNKTLSLMAMRKFICQRYQFTDIEMKKRLPYLKNFLKKSIVNGELINIKGVGLAGSLRLPVKKYVEKHSQQTKVIKQRANKPPFRVMISANRGMKTTKSKHKNTHVGRKHHDKASSKKLKDIFSVLHSTGQRGSEGY